MQIFKQLDQNLLNLAWSLWTELGVAGVKHHHQKFLILIEELLILTAVLSEADPRLRDESLDWCFKYSRFISVSRLKSLINDFSEQSKNCFSKYATIFNQISNSNWPVFAPASPLNIKLSNKSILRPNKSAALLNIRARSIFGTGSRADILTFFLVHPNIDFSIAQISEETNYSKSSLTEMLDDLYLGNLFEKFRKGNQQRYRLKENTPLINALNPIPTYKPWHQIFKILLDLRECLLLTQKLSESTKVVELLKCLKKHESSLQLLRHAPPIFDNDFSSYIEQFNSWILHWTDHLAKGD